MSNNATLPTTPAGGPVAEVLGLGAAGTAAYLSDARRREDAAAADRLRGLAHWADLHLSSGAVRAADCGGAGPLGREGALVLGGAGVAAVAEFAIAEVAALLGSSERSARTKMGHALELRDRLPRLWSRVMSGELAPWRACRIAERTVTLPPEAAAEVDAQLAWFAHRVSVSRIDAAVSAALLRFDPRAAAEHANQAAEHRGVDIEHRIDGTSLTTAVSDTPDAVALDNVLNSVATTLGALGDPDSHDVRRAKALGILADPQSALQLVSGTGPEGGGSVDGDAGYQAAAGSAAPKDEQRDASPVLGRRLGMRTAGPVLHIHLHQDAVETRLGVARVTGAGITHPVPVQAVQRWLANLAPGALVKVIPVVDLTQHLSVDAYEHPRALAAQVEHRDSVCVFPWCGRTGIFDLDHIEPYVPPDDGGPPGQTSTANTARLCRFHHRLKTHGGWSYHRRDVTTVIWRSPLGYQYLVDHTGTRRPT